MRISDWSSDVCSSDLLPSAASANRWVFYDRNGAPRSLAEVRQRFAEKLGDDSGALASAREADAPDIPADQQVQPADRSEEHTSELQSLMRISYAVFCLKKKTTHSQKAR